MLQVILIQKLRRVILIRLLVVTFFLTLGTLLFDIEALIYYGVLCTFLFLSLIYTVWLSTKGHLLALIYLQVAFDLLAISVFVHYTGSVDSVMATLYVLPILGAGFIFYPNSPLMIAVLSSLCFTAVVVLDYYHWMPTFLPPVGRTFQIQRDLFYCGYMTYVRVTVFILIGFLSEYLVRTVDRMERTLNLNKKFSTLGEISMHLAHEMKNPLMAISGSIEILRDELEDKLTSHDKKLMEGVIHESARLKDLFDKVLEYAGPESLDIQPVDVKEILDEVFILLESLPKNGREVDIKRDYAEQKQGRIYVDRNRIKQVFLNLVLNAIQAMPQGGSLTVGVRHTSTDSQILFKDTGIGMTRKTRDNLFIPFRSHKDGGTGIGLAIAHKIVRHHGGKIKVKSRPGHGSVFMVSLPHLV